MNYLNILDSISDKDEIYFLPVSSNSVISYNNSKLIFHVITLKGEKTVGDIEANYDSNGVYFDPQKLSVFMDGVYFGLYLEIKTRDTRDYYPGQTLLYFKRVTDSQLEITYDLPSDLIDGRVGI